MQSISSYVEDITQIWKNKIEELSLAWSTNNAVLYGYENLHSSSPGKEGFVACQVAFIKKKWYNWIVWENNKHYVKADGMSEGSKLGMNYFSYYMEHWDKRRSVHSHVDAAGLLMTSGVLGQEKKRHWGSFTIWQTPSLLMKASIQYFSLHSSYILSRETQLIKSGGNCYSH